MIALDTSALLAVVLDEPQAQACRAVLQSEAKLIMSAGTMTAALIIAGHRGFAAALLELLDQFGIEIVPVTAGIGPPRGGRPSALGPRRRSRRPQFKRLLRL